MTAASLDELPFLWIDASREALEKWADRLLEELGEVKVSVHPRPALVMMPGRDSVERELFCAGELLVTECQILCGDKRFWGRVAGNEGWRALGLAILAAAQALAPPALEALREDFEEERQFLLREMDLRARAVGSTRVHFDTMTLT
jgi:phosphonate C-P lyase system protein PhnG